MLILMPFLLPLHLSAAKGKSQVGTGPIGQAGLPHTSLHETQTGTCPQATTVPKPQWRIYRREGNQRHDGSWQEVEATAVLAPQQGAGAASCMLITYLFFRSNSWHKLTMSTCTHLSVTVLKAPLFPLGHGSQEHILKDTIHPMFEATESKLRTWTLINRHSDSHNTCKSTVPSRQGNLTKKGRLCCTLVLITTPKTLLNSWCQLHAGDRPWAG